MLRLNVASIKVWTFLMVALLVADAAASVASGADASYSRPQLLLEPAELAKPDVAGRYTILDVRSEEAFAEQRIPGARWVDHGLWAKAFGDGDDAEQWGQRIGELGIANGSKVVLYDDSQMKNAARIWWILRYWGVSDARLLNGGWKAWQTAELPTADGQPTEVTAVKFEPEKRRDWLATKSDILGALNGVRKLQIIDSRSEGEFCGTAGLSNKRAGAIPSAKHLEWSDLVDAETHRFKSAVELRQIFNNAGIDLNRPTATHCQSGGRASVMVFGFELMGASQIQNYYRGWSEWGNEEATPIEPGQKSAKNEPAKD
ncbi:MAG: sulfurtransferase [Planctomycetales bacterium]|nr:sulfurtransferase [Planctomycetales bacterium]